jgi:hypothetical protein
VTTRIVFADGTAVTVAVDAESVKDALARSRRANESLTRLDCGGRTIYVAGERVAYLETVAVSHYDEALLALLTGS